MVAKVHCTSLIGVTAARVQVEAQIFGALRRFSIVGLPDGVVRESKDRVRCAIENSGFSFPRQEVIVSLAPASLPKYGSGFDLAIAISILAADGKISPASLESCLLIGELALDGTLKSVPGTLASACTAKRCNKPNLLLPEADAGLASVISSICVFPIQRLVQAVEYLNHQTKILPAKARLQQTPSDAAKKQGFGDVIGQARAKRALEITAAGGHNILMSGPPGSGKSMLARRLTSILPDLALEDSIEATKIYSCLTPFLAPHTSSNHLLSLRPFRAPHHTTSTAGLIGGGTPPRPGEITLAHKGVLFLDEFPEFRRDALEALREPLETCTISISRTKQRIRLPADFILVAAMNPCPCGMRGSPRGDCQCTLNALRRYTQKLSRPLMDRIDLHVWVPPVPLSYLSDDSSKQDPTPDMLTRVLAAHAMQQERFASNNQLNARMSAAQLKKYCKLKSTSLTLLATASERLNLSARGYGKILKLARTIADLERSADIKDEHILEAVAYRTPHA